MNETEINNTQFQISKPLVEKSSVSLHPKFNCGESLPTITDLINHHNLNHKGCPKKMVCEECDQICTHAAMLKIHIKYKYVPDATFSLMGKKALMNIQESNIPNSKLLLIPIILRSR